MSEARPIVGVTSARTRLMNGMRERNDWYKTPPRLTQAILDREQFYGPIWDPCCGDGAMAKVVRTAGYTVIASDLIDRGFGETPVDFLLEHWKRADSMIINPPFALADEFALHALQLGVRKLAILQRLAWLEGGARLAMLWKHFPPARMHVFSYRGTLWRGDDPAPQDKGGVMALAWYVFEAGFAGDPAIKWIAP